MASETHDDKKPRLLAHRRLSKSVRHSSRGAEPRTVKRRTKRRTSMLKGFNYPLTPKGKSTLNPLPPWYYSADFLNIEFWSHPSALAALLPTGLDPDPSANGHGNALFYDWQFSGDNEEYLDPARYQYREFFILVDALYEGRAIY